MTKPLDARENLTSVFTPVQVGPVTLKNRVAIPPMSSYFQRSGRYIEQRHVDYYRERAQGGVGLITTEQQLAAGNTKFRANCLTAFEEGAIPGFVAAADAVHEHGAKLFVELLTPGAWDHGTSTLEDWHVPRGPSAGWIPYLGEYVEALTHADIRQLLADMTKSADNVRRGGIDGVELHGAHGYLIQQFMSRELNRRTDEYGGSVANRARFAVQLGEAARAGMSDSMALGVRLSIEEFKGEQGVTADEMMEMIDLVAHTGVYDFFDISCGGFGMAFRTISPMSVPEGFLLQRGADVKKVVGERAKVFIVGRIVSIEMADAAVRDGQADVICMARAHLAEPRLVQKTLLGRSDEVIRCIGTNVCSGQPMTNCMLNPISGRDGAWGGLDLDRADSPKRVVVIGGGPAGLKAASTAAGRGHHVTLIERSSDTGGSINTLKVYPTRSTWQYAIDDLTRVALKRGVEIKLHTHAEPAMVAALEPDVVVCATGGRFDLTSVAWVGSASSGDRVIDLFQATSLLQTDPHALGANVVIADEVGAYAPLGLAEMAAQGGSSVIMVSSRPVIGEQVMGFEGPYVMPRLVELGVNFWPQTVIRSLDSGTLRVTGTWGNGERLMEAVDTIVVSLPKVPSNELVDDMRGVCSDVRVIGDAAAPRTVREAIYEGELFGRSL